MMEIRKGCFLFWFLGHASVEIKIKLYLFKKT